MLVEAGRITYNRNHRKIACLTSKPLSISIKMLLSSLKSQTYAFVVYALLALMLQLMCLSQIFNIT